MIYLHCASCVRENKSSRLEVSVDRDGLEINCMRHQKRVALIDPVLLASWMLKEPECELCRQGVPHKH